MFRTRILTALAVVFCGSLWLGGVALQRMLACLSCGQWPSLFKLGLITLACGASAFVSTAVFIRTFRAEVRKRDALYEKYRDKDAPPWAQQ